MHFGLWAVLVQEKYFCGHALEMYLKTLKNHECESNHPIDTFNIFPFLSPSPAVTMYVHTPNYTYKIFFSHIFART